MKTREDAWYWMAGHLNFSRLDRDFIRNVRQNRLDYLRPVTPAQADLWERLVYKYQRQIRDNSQDPDTILALPWANSPQSPGPDHSTSRIWIEGRSILMASPYHQPAVQAWRDWRRQCRLNCQWDPDLKIWIHDLGLHALRSFVAYADRMRLLKFADFQLDQRLVQLMAGMDQWGGASHWRPQARATGDRWIVSNLTRDLEPHLPSSDITLANIESLADLGIDIADDLRHRSMQGLPQDLANLLCQRRTIIPASSGAAEMLVDFLAQRSWRVAMVRGNQQEYQHLQQVLSTGLAPGQFTAVSIDTVRSQPGITELDLWISPIYNSYGGWYDIFEQRSRRILAYLEPGAYIDTQDNP